MSNAEQRIRSAHRIVQERPPFEQIVLLLQGGGALGAYQAGVHEALAEANFHPDWVAALVLGQTSNRNSRSPQSLRPAFQASSAHR